MTFEKLKKLSILLNCIEKQGCQNKQLKIFVSEWWNELRHSNDKIRRILHSLKKFNTSRPDEAEKFDDFVNKLKTLSYECELKELRDSLIKDMIIIGTNNLCLQEKLLLETNLTQKFAIKTRQTAEATKRQRELKEVNFTKSEKKNPPKKQLPAGEIMGIFNDTSIWAIRKNKQRFKTFKYVYYKKNYF